jgi:hypothetical protein
MAGRPRVTRTDGASKWDPTENSVQRTRSFTGLWVVFLGDVAIASAAIYGVIRSDSGQDRTQIVAILTSAFTAIGTMTAAYFGIRAASNTAQAAAQAAAQANGGVPPAAPGVPPAAPGVPPAAPGVPPAAPGVPPAAPGVPPAAPGVPPAAPGVPPAAPGVPPAAPEASTEANVDTGGLVETNVDVPEEEVTPYDGATELDQDGDPQPVADADEDDDPFTLAGEELPDKEDGS